MGDKPVIYIAGPYTMPDPAVNVREACLVAESIVGMGGMPMVPVLMHLWHLISPHGWQYWMNIDLALLEKADGLYRMAGESKGADMEVLQAHKLGVPVFDKLSIVGQWIRSGWPRKWEG